MNLLRVMTAHIALLDEEAEAAFYDGQISVIPLNFPKRINRARRRQLLCRAIGIVNHDRILCGSHDLVIGADSKVGLIKSAS